MKKEDLRIIFMGTPEFAVASLRMLVENNYNVVAVVTQPDKPVGRHGSVLKAPAVKEYALAHNLPVLQPEKMKDHDFQEKLATYKADLQVVVAFRILPESVWAMPKYGTFNVHAALLPQYRGAAPINWAIINGETKTGVTTFFLDHDVDTGRIIMQKEFAIPDDADVEYVYNGLMALGAQICKDTIDKLIEGNGTIISTPQGVVKDLKNAPKIFKETCEINFAKSSKQIYDFIRGLSPIPGAWANISSDIIGNQTIKIYKSEKTDIKCNVHAGCLEIKGKGLYLSTMDNWLKIIDIQLPGKKRMTSADFINGLKGSRK